MSPVISQSSTEYVHHIVAYLCTNLNNSHVGASNRCSGEIDIGLCRFTGVIFAAWAVGGTVSPIVPTTTLNNYIDVKILYISLGICIPQWS